MGFFEGVARQLKAARSGGGGKPQHFTTQHSRNHHTKHEKQQTHVVGDGVRVGEDAARGRRRDDKAARRALGLRLHLPRLAEARALFGFVGVGCLLGWVLWWVFVGFFLGLGGGKAHTTNTATKKNNNQPTHLATVVKILTTLLSAKDSSGE